MGLFDFSLLSNPYSNAPFMARPGVGEENCSGWVLHPCLCGSSRLQLVPSVHTATQSPAHSPLLPWRFFIHGRLTLPRPQCGSRELSCLSAHSWLFLSGIQFSRLPSVFPSSYSYINVQFLPCLGFSCWPYGNEGLSHSDLNQKSPVLRVLLHALSGQQYVMDILPCEHKEVYLIILEF